MIYANVEEFQYGIDKGPMLPGDAHLHLDALLARGGMNHRSEFHRFRPGAEYGKYFHPFAVVSRHHLWRHLPMIGLVHFARRARRLPKCITSTVEDAGKNVRSLTVAVRCRQPDIFIRLKITSPETRARFSGGDPQRVGTEGTAAAIEGGLTRTSGSTGAVSSAKSRS